MLVPTITIDWRPVPRGHNWRAMVRKPRLHERQAAPVAECLEAPQTRHLRRDIGLPPEPSSPTYLDLM